MPLAEGLVQHWEAIDPFLFIGIGDWVALIESVRAEEENKTRPCFSDEVVWTFLLCCAYAAATQEDGVALLSEKLTGKSQRHSKAPKIWFEVCPIPPRLREGNSQVDPNVWAVLMDAFLANMMRMAPIEEHATARESFRADHPSRR
jgi:hypothetical protein